MSKYQDALNHMEACKYENRCKNCKMKLNCTFEEDHNLLQELVYKVENLEIENAKLKEENVELRKAIEILKPMSQVDKLEFANMEGYFISCMSHLTKEEYDQLKKVLG